MHGDLSDGAGGWYEREDAMVGVGSGRMGVVPLGRMSMGRIWKDGRMWGGLGEWGLWRD